MFAVLYAVGGPGEIRTHGSSKETLYAANGLSFDVAPGHTRPDDPEIVRAASPVLPQLPSAGRLALLNH
jgi:hypothetical protein